MLQLLRSLLGLPAPPGPTPPADPRALGAWGEAHAALHARREGACVLDRGVLRPGAPAGEGELDLVLDDHGVLAFVEVKTRRRPGTALQAVDAGKRRRLARAAQAYLRRQGLDAGRVAWRFDIITVEPGGPAGPQVTWYKAAFSGR